MPKRKIAFHTLGCKVNSYETDAMSRLMEEAGYETVPFAKGADVYVIHTCSVTNIADRKSRQMLHRAKAMNGDAVVVAVGCYAQAAGEALLQDEAVDIVIGNEGKKNLPEILEAYFANRTKTSALTDIGKCRAFEEMPANCSEKTRAFLKIEDGCNQFCSYCLIPYVRGRVRSRRPEDVMEEAKRLVALGFSEIVLTGIHLSSYGLDFDGDAADRGYYGAPLMALMKQLDALPGLKRLRLGSLEPRIITEDFVRELAGLKTLCPHFHLSLQSGCDATLKRMNRKYSAEEFFEKTEILRRILDRPALTTDVIAGFPGETEEEFEETLAFLRKIRFYETHVFRYSRRKGTVADRLPDQVPEEVKARRSEELLQLNEINKAAYEAAFLGEVREVLLEEKTETEEGSFWTGHTREYLKVKLELPEGSAGQLVSLKLEKENLLGGESDL